ncbi:MAG TPA: ABC transporter ATP-binding protein [Candidatus Binatia bacterium]|nr:ABC transporter ATP-binding protein [Candidatus Binatia bacterium]
MTPAHPREGDGRAAGDRGPDDPASGAEALLDVRAVVKRFGAVRALDGVDFRTRAGEIHALLGENGAGKSTLMNVVSGLYAPDAGAIRFGGRTVRWRSPEEARSAGIAMVHQHFMLVPSFTIAENVALARGALGWLPRARTEEATRALAARYRVDVGDPARRIDDISVGDRQRVEILKALAAVDGDPTGAGSTAAARLLVLDEPTAVLTPDEVAVLFELLRDLAAHGTAVVIVTHKLAEVLALADRVTILRGGRAIASGPAARFEPAALAALMVGAPAEVVARAPEVVPAEVRPAASSADPRPRRAPTTAPPVIVAERLCGHDRAGAIALDGVSLTVAAGEIVAVAGVEGNGQWELVAALAGFARDCLRGFSGRVAIAGRSIASAADARDAGLAIVPADRTTDGLVAELPAWENLLLARDRLRAMAPRGVVPRARALSEARSALAAYEVQPPDPLLPAGLLSGGNQQRLVLARELGRQRPAAIVAANPSRGLDLAATAAVRRRLREHARAGAAVLVLSTDLDEVEEIADRIVVLYRGRLIDAPSSTTRAAIGRLMAGSGVAA